MYACVRESLVETEGKSFLALIGWSSSRVTFRSRSVWDEMRRVLQRAAEVLKYIWSSPETVTCPSSSAVCSAAPRGKTGGLQQSLGSDSAALWQLELLVREQVRTTYTATYLEVFNLLNPKCTHLATHFGNTVSAVTSAWTLVNVFNMCTVKTIKAKNDSNDRKYPITAKKDPVSH